MKRATLPYIFGLLSIGGAACEQVVEIDFPDHEPRLVVEGWVYDDRNTQTVFLHTSIPYSETGTFPAETGAQVVVNTRTGDSFVYDEVEVGVYQGSFRGVVGQEYMLTIETQDGQRYVSEPQRLRPVAPLDSVYAVFKDSTEVAAVGYYPAWDYTDPRGTSNHYRWKFYVNDTLQDRAQDMLVLSDEFIDGEAIVGAEFLDTDPLDIDDTLAIEQLSLSQEALNFLSRVQRLSSDEGRLLDTSPDPAHTNIINVIDAQRYALGFFGASSVVRTSAVVKE